MGPVIRIEGGSWATSKSRIVVSWPSELSLKGAEKESYWDDFIGQSADTGGLGKLVVQEMARRRSETFEPAQKTDKHGHIKLFNEDLDAGRVKLARNSPLASEMAVLPKVAGWLPEAHDGKPAPEDPRFPNHCCDAGLYAWRYAYPFLHEPEEQGPAKGSPEAYAKEEAEYEERLADQDEENERRPWWER